MVVLLGENNNSSSSSIMLGSGPNQYIQPDYLGPLPSTLDSKQSPLALLAQTCSQIGSDTPTPATKTLLDNSASSSSSGKRKSSTCSDNSDAASQHSSSRPKSSSSSTTSSHSSSVAMATTTPTPTPKQNGKLSPAETNHKTAAPSPPNSCPPTTFRPYEITGKDEPRKNSGGSIKSSVPKKTPPKSPEGSDKSGEHVTTAHHNHDRKRTSESVSSSSNSVKKSRQDSGGGGKVSPPSSNSKQDKEKDQGASPIIRSGLEVLQGNDYRKQMTPFSSFYPPPPPSHHFENNPAFRPPLFPGGSHLLPPQHHHFPPTGSPYIGYSRVKSASGGESIVPVCKDPYCGGCQFSGAGGPGAGSSSSSSSAVALMAAAAGFSFPAGIPTSTSSVGLACPIGCLQACDHPKIPYSTAAGMPMPASFFPSLLPPYPPPPSVQTSQSSPPGGSASSRPYVCNWIVGESYCGKRFGNSEELLQHLRTHPTTAAPSVENSSLAAAMMQQQQAAAYSSLLAGLGGHHRTYPTPPLSPLDSAGRYNPYAAAAAMAKAMGHHHPGGLFPPGGPLGPPPASLAGLYSASPYAALYGQKIPQVHP